MKTPEQKYNHDPHFKNLVSMIESLIHEAKFTPSEVREAAMFACIMYESRFPKTMIVKAQENETEVARAIETINKYCKSEDPK